jgi:glycosyltransferase involved in cell wall biosynthesis
MSIKVSVIIPAYNSAQFIVETLESVFAQTYNDYEIIIVDDGSTDNIKEILQNYMSKIRYIYKVNGGPASARNVGIKNADGEYIAFLDSDDLWLPEKLKEQMECFQNNPDIGLVYCDNIRFNENSIYQKKDNIYQPTNGYIFFKLLEGNFITNSTVIVKKKCLEEVDYFDEDINLISSEDYDMWLRISRVFNVGYVKKPLVKYRVRGKGLARSNIDRAYNAQLLAVMKAIQSIGNEFQNKDKFLKNRIFDLQFNWGLSLMDVGNFTGSRDAFLKAYKINPYKIRNIAYCILSNVRITLKH